MSDFGAYLKAQREAKGWTLREAAKRIKVSASRLTEIERGKSYHTDHATKPSREVVERIAQAYDLSKDLLLAEAGYDVGPLSELSPETLRLVRLFESLPLEKRKLALAVLRLFAEDT